MSPTAHLCTYVSVPVQRLLVKMGEDFRRADGGVLGAFDGCQDTRKCVKSISSSGASYAAYPKCGCSGARLLQQNSPVAGPEEGSSVEYIAGMNHNPALCHGTFSEAWTEFLC